MAKLPRELFAELIKRSGYGIRELTREGGWKGPSALHKYTRPAHGSTPIPYDTVIQRVTPFLLGRGDPPITMEELLACTDVKQVSRQVVQAFKNVVEEDDGNGRLAVRYRVERDTLVRPGSNRVLGASKIGASKEFPPSAQFVAVTVEDINEVGPAGTQLHCVSPDQFEEAKLDGRRAVYGVTAVADPDFVEVDVASLRRTDRGLFAQSIRTGRAVIGRVLGVIIGVYRRE